MSTDRRTTKTTTHDTTTAAALELRSVRVTPPRTARGRRDARTPSSEQTAVGRATTREAVLDGVDLTVDRGETVALLGRSGAGKSVTVRTILGLNPTGWSVDGDVVVAGQRVDPSRHEDARQVRLHRAAAVLQDPRGVFNPLRRIGDFATEAAVERGASRTAALIQAAALLEEVGLPEPEVLLQRYPHELSGGMLQRVAIATALSGEPDLLIADEPTAALDVLSQAEVVATLTRAQRDHGFGLLFVTHDLALASAIADRIVVLDGGRIVDALPASALSEATHPTTRALVAATGTATRSTSAQPSTASRSTESSATPAKPGADPDAWPLALQVDGLTRRFDTTLALDDVSLSIERGRTLALVGGSGSGKSTLARIVAGLDRPDAGTARVGTTAERFPRDGRRRRRATPPPVQMVFQDPALSLDPRLTAQAAVSRALGTAGVPRAERASRARQLLDLVGIDAQTGARRTTGLSGGQCQRVSIARALALQPELLVLDEATSALDPETRRQILDLLSEVQATLGLALLVVTHDLGLVTRLADEVVVLHHGRVVEAGPAADVIAAPQAAYTQLLLAALPHRGWRPEELARRRRTLDGGGVDVVDGGRPQRVAGQLQRA